MSIALTCPSCRCPFRVPDDMAGRRVRCPDCGKPFFADYVSDDPHHRRQLGNVRHEQPLIPAPGATDRDSLAPVEVHPLPVGQVEPNP
jgi:predicted Zn finger-like uncharacterized protein